MNLSKQYNNFADKYSRLAHGQDYSMSNKYSKEVFYKHLYFVKPKAKLLDIGCGDGIDMLHYQKLGAKVFGLDSSEEMVAIAKNKLPNSEIKLGTFENMPFEDNYFDIVLSKYAIHISPYVSQTFSEIHRILKPNGIMMYLTKHPIRQYFERKESDGNYFEQKIVDSRVFQNQIIFSEPTHTLQEYLNNFLFEKFDVQMFDEHWEPCAEQIDGKRYPGFFIIKAKKR